MSGSWVLFAYSEVLQMLLAQGFPLTSHTKLFQQLTQHDSKGLGTLVVYKQIKQLVLSSWAHWDARACLQQHPWDMMLRGEHEGRARLDRGFTRCFGNACPVFFLPTPHFAFMKSKFFMNHLYFSFFSPMSFLLHSVAGREASFSAGMLPRKPEVPGFLVVGSAHGFLFLLFVLFYFSSATCAVALTTKCRACSREVWKMLLL